MDKDQYGYPENSSEWILIVRSVLIRFGRIPADTDGCERRSAEGAVNPSLGQRPRYQKPKIEEGGLKARSTIKPANRAYAWIRSFMQELRGKTNHGSGLQP